MSYETGATAITWWAVVSAFGGTLSGGGISYYLARMNLMAAKKQRDEDRREVRKALGLGIVFKMIRLSSELNNLGKSVSDSLSRPEKGGFKGMPFQVFVPTV